MELRVEREVVFPAEPAEVWEALTDPERLEEWFATEAELDPVPGGEGVFRWGDGEERRAVVREAEPEERLVLDWDDGGEVVLELEEVEGGTRVARRRPASDSVTSCFATACRVTGSSAASSVAVAVPRSATEATRARRPGSPSASKTRST
jgi:uncharacterized protein YndB with AHSA1/START domain